MFEFSDRGYVGASPQGRIERRQATHRSDRRPTRPKPTDHASDTRRGDLPRRVSFAFGWPRNVCEQVAVDSPSLAGGTRAGSLSRRRPRKLRNTKDIRTLSRDAGHEHGEAEPTKTPKGRGLTEPPTLQCATEERQNLMAPVLSPATHPTTVRRDDAVPVW